MGKRDSPAYEGVAVASADDDLPEESVRRVCPRVGHFTHGFPTAALSMSNPRLVAAGKWNAQLYEGFRTLASEWQSFVGRRIVETSLSTPA
jgi:hypothetical protein